MYLFRPPMKYIILFILLIGCKPVAKTVSIAPPEPPPEPKELEVEKPNRTADDFRPKLSKRPEATYSETKYTVGSREILVANYNIGVDLTFVNLHDDENTSIEAAVEVIDSLGGGLIQLRHTGDRNVEFRLDGRAYEFDPNRMFTDLGAKASLERFGNFSPKAHEVIRNFADRVVAGINSDVIFTLHNNSEDNYSAESYLVEYKMDAAAVYLNPDQDPDDFYFVTERLFFDALKSRGYNVVLQNNETITDDGSLSVLAGRRKIPYINIEAQHGHLDEQIDMLFTIYELFQ